MTPIRDQEAGVTLIEMLVALSLFALVGIASFTTLDTILRVRERTDGRLEHLAQLDRAFADLRTRYCAGGPTYGDASGWCPVHSWA